MTHWDNYSFDRKLRAFEAIGFKQGEAVKLSSVPWDNFTSEVQLALESKDETYEQKFDDDQEEEIVQSEQEESYDYNNIGANEMQRTKYQCDFCNSGYRSNEALSVHKNDVHTQSLGEVEGYSISASESSYHKKAKEDISMGQEQTCCICNLSFTLANDNTEGVFGHGLGSHDTNGNEILRNEGEQCLAHKKCLEQSGALESKSNEMGDVLINDTPYGHMNADDPAGQGEMGDWTSLYGTSYTDGSQTIVNVPDNEEKAFGNTVEEEGYDWVEDKQYYGFADMDRDHHEDSIKHGDGESKKASEATDLFDDDEAEDYDYNNIDDDKDETDDLVESYDYNNIGKSQ